MVFQTPVEVEAASVASSGPIKSAHGRTGISSIIYSIVVLGAFSTVFMV